MEFATRAIHTAAVDPTTGASSIPVYHASTFAQKEPGSHQPYIYGRTGNPTRAALEQLITDLEEAHAGFAFASGMAAVSAVLLTLSAGDHVIATSDIYGGSFVMLSRHLARFGVTTSFVDATSLDEIQAAFRPNTRMLFLESPSNPTLRITDLSAAARLAREHGVASVVDNTFCTPFLQRPHTLGVDIVIHSATKFLGGHSDVLAGLVTVNSPELAQRLHAMQHDFGGILGPDDAWLVLRGTRTLSTRMHASQDSAGKLAVFLETQPAVRRVFYPGLPGHPGRDIHERQAQGPGAVLSFELADIDAVKRVIQHIHIPLFAVSLGGIESILSHPATMSHASMPPEERAQRGISDGLLRLSVGLEAVDDLMADLGQALSHLT